MAHCKIRNKLLACRNFGVMNLIDLGRSQALPSMGLASDWDGAQALQSIEIKMTISAWAISFYLLSILSFNHAQQK